MTTSVSSGAASPRLARLLCSIAVLTVVVGCSSRAEKADRPENPFRPGSGDAGTARAPKSERELRLEADQAYRRANDALATADYEAAITRYTALIAKYPFSDYATQAELERIFAQYRSLKPDDAVIAADRFLREHPRHPNADYVQYIKGLTDYSRDDSLLDLLPIDGNKRDPTNARRAFDDFALLLQKFPDSRYAGDARKRMLYLRNRIASHELSVVKFYVKRGAWVAASKRAENIIFEYPGAPATAEALVILQQCYSKLGQTPQAADVGLLVASNAASIKAARTAPDKTAARSIVVAAAPGDVAGSPSATAVTAEPPKGFFGRIGGYLDLLNKTYTFDDKTGAATAAAAATTSAPAANPDPSAPASLTTGPYSGPDSVYTLPKSVTDTGAKAAVPAAAAVPEAAAVPAAPKEKGGFFDFLNKTYTIGGPSKKKATAPATTTPEVAPAAIPAETAAPSSSVPAAAPAAVPAAPKEKGGFFDFLNKTYTIGGPSKKNEAAPADASVPAAAPEPSIRVYLDYEDEEAKQKAEADAAKAKADAAAQTPTAEPAK